jgi:hypothetical protein
MFITASYMRSREVNYTYNFWRRLTVTVSGQNRGYTVNRIVTQNFFNEGKNIKKSTATRVGGKNWGVT